MNAKNGFGGYAGFRDFVIKSDGGSKTLRFGPDPLWCSEIRNKKLVEEMQQLRSVFESCSHAKDENASACEDARASVERVRKLGGTPPPIPIPYAVQSRTFEFWAALCESSGDPQGTSCQKANDAETQLKSIGVMFRSRAAIRQDQLIKATRDFELWSAKCIEEQRKADASSCKHADDAASKMKILEPTEK